MAERLFGNEPAAALIGRGLHLRGIPFEIIGVLEAKGVLADDSDEGNTIVIPIRTALRRVFNVAYLNTVFVTVRGVREQDGRGPVEAAQAEIGVLLRQRHWLRDNAQADDFAVQDKAKAPGFAAGDGGHPHPLRRRHLHARPAGRRHGILALMLLSVKERTEILAEATALALGGWLAGLALAALGNLGLALGTSWKVALPAGALLASLAMALLTVLGFGAVPARWASRLPPSRALGTE